MAASRLPSPEVLRQLLRYEPVTGELFWRERPADMFGTPRAGAAWNARYANRQAFTALNSSGYHHGGVLSVDIAAHQAIWAMHYGVADRFIDHINGQRADNRIENLRLVTPTQNSTNQKVSIRNTSGFKGVRWSSDKRKWQATINHNRKFRHLGYFDNIGDAAHARSVADKKYHAEYARAT